ncbi:DHH family phosphoesterase [Gaoshiqia sediminis]|uniref:Bifunctional oligoribonuclease/PAP phosphatase NrnA n=1 Tax=Gaoshiqia sediminis TaxID=2986998 RepID=A0AA41Y931_9BACT|nr:bifunctional oligoribonuclease/PAP phosphatase NrnA [Gaoshiqia sediminis]MCW0484155.1 bifunctional oligoribonuclease/PAP phosphatase NrnA [Gaoshiqia sediminis]
MKPFDIEIIKSFSEKLGLVQSPIVIMPHVNPDGDAVGSALGFANVLKNAGKQVVVISPNLYPDFYKWMAGSAEVVIFNAEREKSAKIMKEAGMLICLDFNHLSRTGEMIELVESFEGPSILIDHHPYPQNFTDLIISHPEYSSTAELVFHVVKALGMEPFVDKWAAECLFCGIMTDTGSFDYNVSDPQTFKTVSELLTYNINPEEIHGRVFDNYSVDRMRLLGYCLSECMEVYPEYHAAMIFLTKEVQKRYNFAPGDSEGFVNYPLSIKGVHFSTLFTEKDDQVKASFRSKGDFPVNEFASSHFNGGGHRNASGGEVTTNLQDTLTKYRSLLPEYAELLTKTKC